ncbi:MAG: DUF4012 domain-containing protein [Acidimicrobiales bacterium]
MTDTSSTATRQRATARPTWASIAVGLAAAFAPAQLTGNPLVDALERALLTGFVAYVGAHARRWTWLLAGLVTCAVAGGASLGLALAGLATLVAACVPRRRPRWAGALGIGLLANAVLWFPTSSAPHGPLLVAIAWVPLVSSGLHYMRNPRRKVARRILIGTAAFVVVAGLAAALAMALAYSNVQRGADSARAALDEARDGNADAAKEDLSQASSSFGRAASRAGGVLTIPARVVPGLSQQVAAIDATVDEGRRIAGAGSAIASTADYDELRYQGQLDLTQVRALQQPTEEADQTLATAERRLRDVRAGALLPPLRSRLDDFAEQVADARRDTSVATSLLQVTPGLFGGDGDRRYLVLFQTPAELRGAGGFIGSYAELTAADGKVSLSRAGRIRELIDGAKPGARAITGPADYLARYGRFAPQDYLQDVTLSPNFPSDAQVMSELYPQSGGKPVDGVISVDPTGLAALLELTGPVEVPGLDQPLTADNAVQVLTKDQYLDVPDEAERGEILTAAIRATFEKLTSSSLPAPREIADALSPAARAGHLRMWSPDRAEQRTFEELGADGSLVVPDGWDGLSVVQQNAGNNKIDAYLHRRITYSPKVDARTGKLEADLRIELRNDVPSLDLPDVVLENSRAAPRGTNVTWLTVFTPQLVTTATIDGKPLAIGTTTERGLNAIDTTLVRVPPQGRVVIEMHLSGGVDLRDGYHLRILPQPVANPDRFGVVLTVANGRADGAGGAQFELLELGPVTKPTDLHAAVGRSGRS